MHWKWQCDELLWHSKLVHFHQVCNGFKYACVH